MVLQKAFRMVPDTFRCYLVQKTGKDHVEASLERRPIRELPAGDLLIRVACSSVNYKDALAATGHPGVARSFPHIPGIDAAGTVVESASPDFRSGDEVVVTSYELGVERWGGWAEYVRVPAAWVLPVPAGFTLVETMMLGTAGLTAGLCVQALQRQKIDPDAGEVLVTGATGGVGSLSVMLLSRLGYRVVAVTGKTERHAWLRDLGASQVIGREEILDSSKRPLLSARWAGAVDTVGGSLLASLLRAVKKEGCVACCGMVGGAELPMTVFPFILRGVTLAGIETAWCPLSRRLETWKLLAGSWRPESLHAIGRTIGLEELDACVRQMLAGQCVGRTVVDLTQEN